MGSLIYVVDDKEIMREPVLDTLSLAGYQVQGFSCVRDVQKAIEKKKPDLIVTDLSMPELGGMDLLHFCRETDPQLPVVLMTAYASVETAIEAIKAGAYDYLRKPFEADELELVVARALESRRLKEENFNLKQTLAIQDFGTDMIGEAPSMQALKQHLSLVAVSNSTVMVLGESGTGKEVLAREIHRLSPRANKPFLAVNCAALSAGILESELFGHEKGSFTGAEALRKGRFELACGGTLLLDEITEMDISLQAKLLRVLQEKVIERVGSSQQIPVDVRLIATSNRDLVEAVKSGHLRQDLFYRLNVIALKLPPLRERKEDIPSLVACFMRKNGKNSLKINGDILEKMKIYDWPGNVRELGNLVERACVLRDVKEMLPRQIKEKTIVERFSENLTLEEIEKKAIEETLKKYGGKRKLTAQHLDIAERTLRDKIKRWEIA
jgi:DNA-binding NtrC family response regulator